jgi:hypothetical protein
MKKYLLLIIFLGFLVPGKLLAGPYWFTFNGGYSPSSQMVCGTPLPISQSWTSGGTCAGPSFTYTVRWYYNTTNTTNVGTAVLVQTTTGVDPSTNYTSTLAAANIVVPPTAGATYYYFVTVSGGCSGAYNNPSTTVPVTNANASPVGGTATPSAGSVGCGGTATITLTGFTGAIQWQISTDGGTTWYNISGAINSTLATGALYSSTKFRARVTSGCPTQTTATSTVATVNNSGITSATWLTSGTTAWATASNWSTGVVPTQCTDVTIPAGGTQPTVSTANASCHNLTINAGAILTNSSTTFNIYGNLTNNGNLNDAVGYTNLYGNGCTWGGTGTYMNGATQQGWICIKDGANYTVVNNLQPVLYLGGNNVTAASTGSLSFGSYTVTVTGTWYCVFYNKFNTGMLNLRGGGSVDVTKSDYGTGILWVNSSVNNFGFNLEDDYYTVWFTNTAGNTRFGSAAIDVYIKQDMWIKSPCNLDLTTAGTNAIVVGHDFINDDVLSAATSTIRMQDFNVAQAQNITTTNGTITTFNGLEIKNSGTGVYLQVNAATNATSTGLLTLTSGPFYLNSHMFTVQRSATTAVARNGTTQTGYIVSETNVAVNPSILQWNIGSTNGVYVIPFGVSSTGYIPLTFQKTAGNSNMRFSTRATPTANTPWAGVSSVAAVSNMNRYGGDSSVTSVIDRWWDISAVSGYNAVTATVTFSYLAAENTLPVSPPYRIGPIAAQHWNGTMWEPPVCSACNNGVTSGVGTVTVSGANTFSPWILVAQPAPLPITLLSFNATAVSEGVSLNWVTTSEINNDYFTVERSNDAVNFQAILTVDGAGNSSRTIDYSTLDANPLRGVSYYRLRQTDFDNKTTVSDVVAVNISDNGNLLVVPNPASNFVNIIFAGEVSGEHHIEVMDDKGTVVLRATENLADKKYYRVSLENYSKGIYLIRLTDKAGTSQTGRFIIN